VRRRQWLSAVFCSNSDWGSRPGPHRMRVFRGRGSQASGAVVTGLIASSIQAHGGRQPCDQPSGIARIEDLCIAAGDFAWCNRVRPL